MGNEIGPPVPIGDHCTLCWGEDKPFGDVDTPKFVIAVFHNVKPVEQSCAVDAKPPIP
ncbi:unnamed protein product [marine sediment metagenome]|uniref:Uncharacterized protein n=1 Tax=marine sediment metagenome TaxID=412755 RepID=X1T809_9ZZZZ